MSCEDIPSLLDLQNTKKHVDDFGRLMGTGTGTSTNGVTGQVRPTYNAVMANLGYTRVGTFASGGTLLNGRQTLLWDVADGGDGQEYGWSGSFPPTGKVVPPGSTPLTTGGIAVGAWMSRFDPELQSYIEDLVYGGIFVEGGSISSVLANTDGVIRSAGQTFSTGLTHWKAIEKQTPFIIQNTTPQLYGLPANGLWAEDNGAIGGNFGDVLPSSSAAIQDCIDKLSSWRGGKVKLSPLVFNVTTTINLKTATELSGTFGDFKIPNQTEQTGTVIRWGGADDESYIVRAFGVRASGFNNLILDGNGALTVQGLLLDSNNLPSSAQNTFEFFAINNCVKAVQWGTTGIVGGSKQADGTIFRQFTIRSQITDSVGFVLNSGNAAQYSSIENGGIEVDDLAIDIVVANQIQLKKIVSGGSCKTAFCRVAIGINILIQGCESENTAGIGPGISPVSKFLLVVPPPSGEAYDMIDTTIVLQQNTINNPILVTYPCRIVTTGDAWNNSAGCDGTFTNGVSELVILNNGVPSASPLNGWRPSAFVNIVDLSPTPSRLKYTSKSSPTGYVSVIEASTQNAADDLAIEAIDTRPWGGALWEVITTAAGSLKGAAKKIFRVGGNKDILTLHQTEVVIGQASTDTRLRFAEAITPTNNQAGTALQIAVDTNYIYVWTGPNTVKRVPLQSF